MIRSFADRETERIRNGERSRYLPPDIQATARRKLRQLEAVEHLQELAIPRGNRLEQLKGFTVSRYSIRINDQWRVTLAGRTEARTMSGSRTIITDKSRLDNIHPGDVLREDFLIGTEISEEEVAAGAGVDAAVLRAIVASERGIDPSTDARLTRYFGMSDGFFLRLQVSYDVEEVRRCEAEALDRIVPRAA